MGVDNSLNNPLCMRTIDNIDELRQKRPKQYYGIVSEKYCSWLKRIFGKKILPPLSDDYDRCYIVDSGTVKIRLLKNSGYRILHRPYFAMKGSTHAKWQLNPHTKTGVDAAKEDEEAITFRKYLDLFYNHST